MNQQALFDSVRNLIIEGKTGDVFDLLRKHIDDSQVLKTLAIIESEYNDVRQSELKGTLNVQDLQTKKNQINDKLLGLFQEGKAGIGIGKSRSPIFRYVYVALAVVFAALAWWFWLADDYECPSYPASINNKILVLPFVNSGNEMASPHIILRDRINQLVEKNGISANAQLGGSFDDMTLDKAPLLTKECPTDLLVWGTYAASTDSIRLILQYYFTNQPDWSNSGELVASKDVTSLFNGRMLKSLDDAIFSLCGVLAFREGDNALAKKWFEKVGQKEEMDRKMLEILE